MPGPTTLRAMPVRRLLLAVIFLAVLAAGVGYGLGALSRHQRAAAATGGQQQGGITRCPAHTEEQAGVSPLYQALYLRTAQSEVWICQDVNGKLYYQGHRGQPGDQLVEGKTALYLPDVEREGTGFVARNSNSNGVTTYHVTSGALRIDYPSGQEDLEPATN